MNPESAAGNFGRSSRRIELRDNLSAALFILRPAPHCDDVICATPQNIAAMAASRPA